MNENWKDLSELLLLLNPICAIISTIPPQAVTVAFENATLFWKLYQHQPLVCSEVVFEMDAEWFKTWQKKQLKQNETYFYYYIQKKKTAASWAKLKARRSLVRAFQK